MDKSSGSTQKTQSLRIESKRLILLPFTSSLLHAAESGDAAEYAALGITPSSEWPESDLLDALPVFRSLAEDGAADGFSPWIALDKDARIVGSAGFLGRPENGAVEIGFGIVPSERGRGHCTEAVEAIIRWVEKNGSVAILKARCEPENLASISVLEKSGFTRDGEAEGLLEWSRPTRPSDCTPGEQSQEAPR